MLKNFSKMSLVFALLFSFSVSAMASESYSESSAGEETILESQFYYDSLIENEYVADMTDSEEYVVTLAPEQEIFDQAAYPETMLEISCCVPILDDSAYGDDYLFDPFGERCRPGICIGWWINCRCSFTSNFCTC